MKEYIKAHKKVLGTIGVVVALGVAVLYAIIIPGEAGTTSGVLRYILMYAHSACWVLLATASALWAIGRSPRFITGVAYGALALYVLFICTFMAVNFL